LIYYKNGGTENQQRQQQGGNVKTYFVHIDITLA
jgi:hypothetical protein